MPSKKSHDRKLADQANELYWQSGQSVNQIAEVMDLSKSGLYALIRPLPAERACPECGEGLVFPNRTTEHKAIASCLECEYVDEVSGPGSEVRPPRKQAVRRSDSCRQTQRGTAGRPRTRTRRNRLAQDQRRPQLEVESGPLGVGAPGRGRRAVYDPPLPLIPCAHDRRGDHLQGDPFWLPRSGSIGLLRVWKHCAGGPGRLKRSPGSLLVVIGVLLVTGRSAAVSASPADLRQWINLES